jgi:hypothetical protein
VEKGQELKIDSCFHSDDIMPAKAGIQKFTKKVEEPKLKNTNP